MGSEKGWKNLKPQKPGEPSHNPLGRTVSPHVMEIKRLTREQVAEIGTLLLHGDEDDLEKFCEQANVPMIKKMIARVLRKTSNRGDHKGMVALIEQIAGKQVQEVKVRMSVHASLVKMVNDAEGGDDDE